VSNTSSKSSTSSSSSLWIAKRKKEKSLEIGTSENDDSTLGEKVGWRFFSKRSKVRSLSPNSTAIVDGISKNSHYTSQTDVKNTGSDIDVLFRKDQTKEISDVNSEKENWKNGSFYLGTPVSPQQNSEASVLTNFSRRSSLSYPYSAGNTISPRQKSEPSKFMLALRVTSSSNSYSTELAEGEELKPSSGGSVVCTQSNGWEKIKTLGESLCTIPDNSTDIEELPQSTMYGNVEGVEVVSNDMQEDLETQLTLQSAAIKEDHLNSSSPPSHSPSPSNYHVTMKRSLLAPVPMEKILPRTVSPQPGIPTKSNPQPFERTHSNAGSFHLIPMNTDLSLEDEFSASVLPTDLSMDLESLALEMQQEDIGSSQSLKNALHDVRIEIETEDPQIHMNSSKSIVIPTDLSIDLESLPQEVPYKDDEIRRSMENILCDLPHEIDDKSHRVQINSRSSISSSECHIMSSGSSSENDMGHMIRSRMLDGSDFDSDYDTNSDTISENNESEKGSSGTRSPPYRYLDDTVMKDRSHCTNSTDSSYHFANIPLELQNDHVSMDVDDCSNSNNEIATASSDDTLTHLEELYSDIGEEEKEGFVLLHPVSSIEEELDATISMLESINDDESFNSSVKSFDTKDFLEDELSDGNSKACCSLSTYDITTIHEENEDDIAEEVCISPKEDRGLLMNQNLLSMRLNGGLHLRRMELEIQGTMSTLSSVTDDSYMRGSFDSFSSVSERKNSPRGSYCKITGWKDGMNINTDIDMNKRESFSNEQTWDKSNDQQSLDDESSLVSFSDSSGFDSACSYDYFSSKSAKYMMDILKEETERQRRRIKERIAMIRESTDKVICKSECDST